MQARFPIRPILAALALALMASCAPKNDLSKPPPPLGRFLLGTNVVITDGMQKSPVSRTATGEEWQAALKQALKDRFGRYDGDTYYDMAITVEGYALAPPGIPIVLAPKSVLIIQVLIWYDATQKQLNAAPKRFIVFEGTSPQTVIGSGLTRTKAEQLKVLSYNAAKSIEGWLVAHPAWFPQQGEPVAETVAETAAETAAGAKTPAATTAPAAGAAAGTAGGTASGTAAGGISSSPLPAPIKK